MNVTLLYAGGTGGTVSGELVAALVALYVLSSGWERATGYVEKARQRLSGPVPSAIEQLQTEYEHGEIDLQEFERRAELALDDRAAVVADRLKAVNGVGPERAAAIADEFGNIEAVRRAELEEIEKVHGVGSSTAEKIQNEF